MFMVCLDKAYDSDRTVARTYFQVQRRVDTSLEGKFSV